MHTYAVYLEGFEKPISFLAKDYDVDDGGATVFIDENDEEVCSVATDKIVAIHTVT
jgi:hypothetical protein